LPTTLFRAGVRSLLAASLVALAAMLFGAACGNDDDEAADTATASVEATQDAASGAVGDLLVRDAYARSTTNDVAAAYFTLTNSGDADDALLEVSVSPSVAGEAQLHTSVMEGASMQMEQVPEIGVPAGGEVVLEPGGLHVMLLDVPAPIEAGSEIELTLTFREAGELTLIVPVRDVG
jgi:copper(I)-binding protein